MPTYEYKCEQCGVQFDHFQSMTSTPLQTCRDCGGKLRRLIGEGAGIIFKGSGFYCTDYRNHGKSGNNNASTSPGKPAASSSDGESASKSDSSSPASKAGTAAS